MRVQRSAVEGHAARRFGLVRAIHVALMVIVASAPVGFVAGQTTPVGPFTVDLSNRENARRFYFSVHQASEGIPLEWTGGSVANCVPGTISQAYLDATLTRINYFRALAGVPSDVTFTAENNAKAQATALIMAARNAVKPGLDHNPPQDWKCWTQLGRDGAAISNLTWGTVGPTAIDSLMWDGSEVGHRRSLTNPQILSMGSGSVPDTDEGVPAEAQLMVDNPAPPATRRPARDEFVAWPPKGFVPWQNVYPLWSFVLRDADFSGTTVTMQRAGGATVPVAITTRVDFAGPGIVWLADGLKESCQDMPQPCSDRWAKPASDDSITVTLANVVVAGVAREFTYTVTVFDPAVADPSNTALTITGPASPPLNQASHYEVNAIPNALGYQWRTSQLTALELTDGAETGLANFDAVVGGYEPVSTNFAAAGMSAFRLTTGATGGVAGSGQQTLTWKRALVPNADSQLTLKTRANRLENVSAVVEVSADDGSSWTVIYTEQATRDTAFNDRTVSLGAFASQHIQLRLRVRNAGTGATFFAGDEGWYVDDVAFRNILSADPPTLRDASAATSFEFTPTEQAAFDIDVRPQFFGTGFGAWSPARRVSTLAPGMAPPPAAPASDLAGALGGTGLQWTTRGDASWTVQTAVSHDAMAAAQRGAITHSQSSVLEATAIGPASVAFWWKVDSEANFDLLKVEVDGVAPFAGISGNIDWERRTIALPAGAHTLRWTYSKDGSVSTGQDSAWLDEVTVGEAVATQPPVPLETALGAPASVALTTTGDKPWTTQSEVTHDGAGAAQSGVITHAQSSRLEATVSGPATLAFWWKVESEQNFDFLNVDVDGAAPFPGISGSVDWQRQTIALPAGPHIIHWTYAKDGSVSVARDAAWLDQITLE